jgi:hypothetical protein
MTIAQVLDIIDRPAAWAWIRRQYLPDGPICPSCGKAITGPRALEAFERMDRTYCKSCGSNSPARAFIPVLRGTEWQPEEYVKFLFFHLFAQQALQAAQAATLLGKSLACVRDMAGRLAVLDLKTTTGDRALGG